MLAGLPAAAEIYRWVDASGKMHFTQDLAQVPGRYRADAKARAEAPAKASPSQVQHYTPPAPPARLQIKQEKGNGSAGGKTHKIRVQRAGSSMRVTVRVNGQLDVPFVIDTGATDVVIPDWAAKELGLPIDGPGVRTIFASTANGVVQAPVVMLQSVQLGSASVDSVTGIALKGMKYGLLGLSFFNHFNYDVDVARGIVTLTENSLADDGVIRGGRDESRWKGEFRALERYVDATESRIKTAAFGRERAEAEKAHSEALERLRLLEVEADEARVPFAWRD